MTAYDIYGRHGRSVCLCVLLLMPVLLYGAKGAFESNTNNVLDWLPSSFAETQRLFWFIEKFGSDEILVVSWQGCTLDDPRLDQLAAGLVSPVDAPHTKRSIQWFREVHTGRAMLAQLMDEPLRLTREQAIARMRGWLCGPDDETTCAVAMVSEAGAQDRPAAVNFVRQVAHEEGVASRDLHIGGPTADGVAINRASTKWIIELGLLSTILGLLVAWCCLRETRLVAILLVSAMFAWGASLSIVYYSGNHMDAVLLMMPALVFVLTVSGGVHLTNYYKETSSAPLEDNHARLAIRRGWLPCVLATSTTSIGLGSLINSRLIPVKKFGFFSSLGVMLIVVSLLVIWPSLIQCWRSRGTKHVQRRPKLTTRTSPWWWSLYASSSRYSLAILVLFAISMPMLATGLSNMRTSAQLRDLLHRNDPDLQSYRWLQERIGPLVPVEIVLRFPSAEESNAKVMLTRAQIVEDLRVLMEQSKDIGSAIAATTFAPKLPTANGARQIMMRRVVAARLWKNRDQFIESGFLHVDPDEELWRISTRVKSLDIEYGQFLKELSTKVNQFLASLNEEGTVVAGEVSGGLPLIYVAQEQLLKDLVRSFLTAFLLIGLVMVLLLRSVLAGLMAMIPNVFPALVAFGSMGLADLRIDIGTMMTASAAMGIAVDDTLHFLVWFRRSARHKKSRHHAVRAAFRHCATPMLQTSLICGFGLLAFVLSPFAPISRFGSVMALMLALALVGDLILLPALLCSPLGTLFLPRQRKSLNQANIDTVVQSTSSPH